MFAAVKGIELGSIEIDGDGDPYVPISATAGKEWSETIALRYGDYDHSLLEIFFDSTTGGFRRLAMVGWKQPHEGTIKPTVRASGLPILEPPTREFEGPPHALRLDCPIDFTVALDAHTLSVIFHDGGEPIEGIECGRLVFLLNASRQLIGFQVLNLAERDIGTLNAACWRP